MANVHMLRETKLIKIVKISLFLSKNCLLQVKKIAGYPAKSVSSSSLLKTILNVTYFLCYLNPPPPLSYLCLLYSAADTSPPPSFRFDAKDKKFQWYFNQKEKSKAGSFNSQNKERKNKINFVIFNCYFFSYY